MNVVKIDVNKVVFAWSRVVRRVGVEASPMANSRKLQQANALNPLDEDVLRSSFAFFRVRFND